jgi:hypothetical protein
MADSPFCVDLAPDWQGFLRCLRREGTPDRVYFIELLIDDEVKAAVAQRSGLMEGVAPDDPFRLLKREIRVQRFLGYDYVRCGLDDVGLPLDWTTAADTAPLERRGGRQYLNERRGPITTWGEF